MRPSRLPPEGYLHPLTQMSRTTAWQDRPPCPPPLDATPPPPPAWGRSPRLSQRRLIPGSVACAGCSDIPRGDGML